MAEIRFRLLEEDVSSDVSSMLTFGFLFVFFVAAPKPMQEGWGGGEDVSLSAGQWDQDEGDMWNSTASQESNSSCNSWGNPPKKGPQKVS